jgi:hypothetical protein
MDRMEDMAVSFDGSASDSMVSLIMYGDEFWLNLHHFLYVVGRAQAKTGDAKREAVADAPAEDDRTH